MPENIYRAIFNSVNDAILLRDRKTRNILSVNTAFCEMTGYTAHAIKKMRLGWLSEGREQNGKTIEDYFEAAARGEPQLSSGSAERTTAHSSGSNQT
jgi:PAS domain S-box-containing protein